MRFHVPQFIEVESKIFGPLTLKQFIYLAGGGGLCAVIWFFVPTRVLSIILILPVAGFSLAMAFYKVNEKPFIEVVEAAFYYAIRSKLFIWQKIKRPAETMDREKTEQGVQTQPKAPRLSGSSLQDMTWSLDVNAGSSVSEEAEENTAKEK